MLPPYAAGMTMAMLIGEDSIKKVSGSQTGRLGRGDCGKQSLWLEQVSAKSHRGTYEALAEICIFSARKIYP